MVMDASQVYFTTKQNQILNTKMAISIIIIICNLYRNLANETTKQFECKTCRFKGYSFIKNSLNITWIYFVIVTLSSVVFSEVKILSLNFIWILFKFFFKDLHFYTLQLHSSPRDRVKVDYGSRMITS